MPDSPARIIDTLEALAGRWATIEEHACIAGVTGVPADILADMRSSGVLAAPIPTALHGWGSSLAQVAEALRRVARKAPSTALALAMPLGNAATTLIPDDAVPATLRPSLAKSKRWIADAASSGKILAVANSEPGAGGDLANTKTRASLREGRYHLTGFKSFATIGPDADYFLCSARCDHGAATNHREVVDGFFVPRSAPGLALDDKWNPLGMRTTASVGLRLDDAPADALMGYPGCLEGASARHWSTVLFTAVLVGLGEGALALGVHAAPPGAGGQWSRAHLADAALNIDAAAGFLEALAADNRVPFTPEQRLRAQRAKTFAARTAVDVALRASLIAGGRAYSPHHPVARFLRDALAGPLLRPPMAKAMDQIIDDLFGDDASV